MPLSAPAGRAAHPAEVGDHAAVVAERIRDFAAAPTRMLLSSEGLTTTLLEAWTGDPVHMTGVEHHRAGADAVPGETRRRLRAAADCPVLLRRSVTADSRGTPLSANRVTARLDVFAPAESCLTDPAAPLGAALHLAGTGYRRTVVDAGLTAWPGGQPRSAAFKTYLLWHGDLPLIAVTEVFNPAVVPADVRTPSGGGT
jgi:chorismate-pyruvate lyase